MSKLWQKKGVRAYYWAYGRRRDVTIYEVPRLCHREVLVFHSDNCSMCYVKSTLLEQISPLEQLAEAAE